MRGLGSVPLVLLELISCAIRGIEARAHQHLHAQQDGNTSATLAAPIVVEPSQQWGGIDGNWSTFIIRVGTPPSVLRVLPATGGQETFVVYGSATGVCNETLGVQEDCQDDRGGVFNTSSSSTWKEEGQHPLDLNATLGIEVLGQYGTDTIGFGSSNTSGVTLQNQTVSAIVLDDYWFGSLGLGFQPTNLSSLDDAHPSLAETLFAQGKISSRSWSYTAGAYYRLKSVVGSLIFGGYDASRIKPNNVTFNMGGNPTKDLIVTIRSIASANNTLMDTPESAFIDSSVPELWLPLSVCEAFERAFGLELDVESGYYLLNDSTHANLLERKPEFTFKLANQKEGSENETVEIVLPYAAFDFNISAPLLPNRTERYFPLRRAVGGRHILGRTFLQEAYVTAHYGDGVFNVSQCIFEENSTSHIIALPEHLGSGNQTSGEPEPGREPSKSSGRKRLSKGAIAGIVLGVLAFVALFGILVFFLLRRRHKSRKNAPPEGTAAIANKGEGKEKEKRIDLNQASAPIPVPLGLTIKEQDTERSPLDKELGERVIDSPTSPTDGDKGLDDYGEKLNIGPDIDREPDVHDEQRDFLPPTLALGLPAPGGRDRVWIPTSPVRRSGTAGSRFREDV